MRTGFPARARSASFDAMLMDSLSDNLLTRKRCERNRRRNSACSLDRFLVSHFLI
jgi:hypothetical protein